MSDTKMILSCECSEHILVVDPTSEDTCWTWLSMWSRETDKERGRLYWAWQALMGCPKGVGNIALNPISVNRLIHFLGGFATEINGEPHEHEWGEWMNYELNPHFQVRHCTKLISLGCGGVDTRNIWTD
jgi:hypothetical protein